MRSAFWATIKTERALSGAADSALQFQAFGSLAPPVLFYHTKKPEAREREVKGRKGGMHEI